MSNKKKLVGVVKEENRNALNNKSVRDQDNSSLPVESKITNPVQHGALFGGIAGVALGLFIGLLAVGQGEAHVGLRFGKYLLFLPIAAAALLTFRKKELPERYFQKGILVSGVMSAVTGIIAPIIYALFFASGAGSEISKATEEADSLASTLLISSVTFFEILVLGMICCFIILQMTKQSSRPA